MTPGTALSVPVVLADEAGEALALLGWFGLMGLGIYALYLGLVVLVPLGIVTLVRPQGGIDRPLVQSLAGCAAFPPIGLGAAALSRAVFDTRGPSPNWSGLCTGAAIIALPTLALMLAIPARRTTTLIVGLGVWAALAAISGAQDSTLGTVSTSYLSEAIGWALVVWVISAAFVLPAPLILSLFGVGRRSSGVGLTASLFACTACLPVAFLAIGLYLELTDREFPSAGRIEIPISVLVIALPAAFACVIWPRGRWIASVTALTLSVAVAIAMTHWLPS
jgi:hypothetical protein